MSPPVCLPSAGSAGSAMLNQRGLPRRPADAAFPLSVHRKLTLCRALTFVLLLLAPVCPSAPRQSVSATALYIHTCIHMYYSYICVYIFIHMYASPHTCVFTRVYVYISFSCDGEGGCIVRVKGHFH